ncbi:hypothetical protein HYU11_01355 [Candidatus Woesearchaeota archaeon]|nr:hypothetical protein [Candidatus Woesearchaeota archaeon]
MVVSFRSRILSIAAASDKVRIFRMEKDPSFQFRSGQFAVLSIDGFFSREGSLARRSYSISSSNHDDFIEFCITRAENGFFSLQMHNLKVGDFVNVQGPFGVFALEMQLPENTVFVAGGSGISPLMSMIRCLYRENAFPPGFRLFYGFRTPSDCVYGSELQSISAEKGFAIIMSVDKAAEGWKGDVGFVSDVLQRHCDFPRSDVYLCGPPLMVSATIRELLRLGFDEKRIHREQW